jgi:hypothetical protein
MPTTLPSWIAFPDIEQSAQVPSAREAHWHFRKPDATSNRPKKQPRE